MLVLKYMSFAYSMLYLMEHVQVVWCSCRFKPSVEPSLYVGPVGLLCIGSVLLMAILLIQYVVFAITSLL